MSVEMDNVRFLDGSKNGFQAFKNLVEGRLRRAVDGNIADQRTGVLPVSYTIVLHKGICDETAKAFSECIESHGIVAKVIKNPNVDSEIEDNMREIDRQIDGHLRAARTKKGIKDRLFDLMMEV